MTLTVDETRLFTDEVGRLVASCPAGDPARTWELLAGMDLPGLLAPETRGGSGGTLRELVVVAEHAGAALLAAPLLPVAALAVPALLRGCPEDPLLGEIATGDRIAGVLLADGVELRCAGGRVTAAGPLRLPGGTGAGVLLVIAEEMLLALEPAAPARIPLAGVDPARPLESVVLDDTPARVLATGASARAACDAALRAGRLWLAAESIGAARHSLGSTLDYVRSRTTFGRAVGSYQSVKHRCVDRWIDIESAAVLLRGALDGGSEDDTVDDRLLHLALAEALDAASTTARDTVLLHGAIGFTAEHEAHRYVRRARMAATLFGDADRHRDLAAGTTS